MYLGSRQVLSDRLDGELRQAASSPTASAADSLTHSLTD